MPLHKRIRVPASGSGMRHFHSHTALEKILAAEGSAFLIWEMGWCLPYPWEWDVELGTI